MAWHVDQCWANPDKKSRSSASPTLQSPPNSCAVCPGWAGDCRATGSRGYLRPPRLEADAPGLTVPLARFPASPAGT